MPRKVSKPLTNKNRATENRKNYLRARDASKSRSRVRKNSPTTGLARNANGFYETEIDSRLTVHSCGALDIVCLHFIALRWIGLYVAMSRVGSKDSLKIYSDHGVYTSNVVYKEVLRQ